jgi:DNA repair protein RadC
MKKSGISLWPENDRPREKLLLHGASTLGEAELIAILIRSGTKTHSAVDLAREVLKMANNDMNDLCRLSVIDLSSVKGLGKVRAISLVAAFELGRRRKRNTSSEKVKITGSKDAVNILQPVLADLSHEEFHILLLNRAHRVIGQRLISKGGISGTVVDPKLIFSGALEMKASAVILSHNHPSGNTKPSEADIQLTRKLKEGGLSLEISVLDHIIIAGSSFYSFADEGLL